MRASWVVLWSWTGLGEQLGELPRFGVMMMALSIYGLQKTLEFSYLWSKLLNLIYLRWSLVNCNCCYGRKHYLSNLACEVLLTCPERDQWEEARNMYNCDGNRKNSSQRKESLSDVPIYIITELLSTERLCSLRCSEMAVQIKK